jgi:hypothetical protein
MLSVLNVLGMSPLFPGFVLIQYQSNLGFLTSFKDVLLINYQCVIFTGLVIYIYGYFRTGLIEILW